MASGYSQILYRLSGVLIDSPSLEGDVNVIRQALEAYFLGDSLDEVSRELAWLHFVLPGFLIGYSGFMFSESHLIRLNEYMYHQLSNNVPLVKEQEASVLGAIALLIDVGSNENPEISIGFLEEVLYDLFPGLETFLRQVEPNQAPFVTAVLDLTRLSDFMTSIQVVLLYYQV